MTKPWIVHIVDDDAPVRDALSFALLAVGLRVAAYVDAQDFLEHRGDERGVLLSDVRMPGMNGIELTRRLRQDGSSMPIILMTGHATEEIEAEAIDAGADIVLGKPVVWSTLIAEIERVSAGWW